MQNPTKRPDAVQTFDLLMEFELWHSHDDASHKKSSQRSNELQHQLTQVTDELNQLKMQLAAPQPNNDSKDIKTHCCGVAIQYEESTSCTCVSVSQTTCVKRTEDESSLDLLNENEDKDSQIRVLSKRLLESDEETIKLKQEIDRLRDIINQRNG